MEDGIDLDDESGHHDYGAQGKTQEAKSVRSLFQGHDNEAGDQDNNADNHPLIIFLAKGEFVHIFLSRSIQIFQRHSKIFPDGEKSADHGDNHTDNQQ